MSQQQSFTDQLWDFFCSLKLAIITLILLAMTSIIGTVIQQNKSPQEYMEIYGMSESTYKTLNALQFFDMYHSYWFLSLLGIFAVNLICCSIKRLPRIIKVVREPVFTADDGLFRTFSNREEIVAEGTVESVRDKIVAVLGQKFAKPVITDEDGKAYLFSQKGAFSRFGVYVTHTSILIIFLGAMIGNIWGLQGVCQYRRRQVDQLDLAAGRAKCRSRSGSKYAVITLRSNSTKAAVAPRSTAATWWSWRMARKS